MTSPLEIFAMGSFSEGCETPGSFLEWNAAAAGYYADGGRQGRGPAPAEASLLLALRHAALPQAVVHVFDIGLQALIVQRLHIAQGLAICIGARTGARGDGCRPGAWLCAPLTLGRRPREQHADQHGPQKPSVSYRAPHPSIPPTR